jgi:hypothetical protein
MGFSLADKFSNHLVFSTREPMDRVPADEASVLTKETELRFEVLGLKSRCWVLVSKVNLLNQRTSKTSNCSQS